MTHTSLHDAKLILEERVYIFIANGKHLLEKVPYRKHEPALCRWPSALGSDMQQPRRPPAYVDSNRGSTPHWL
jgi:hypothetical protein